MVTAMAETADRDRRPVPDDRRSDPADIFTREDLTDEQRLFGQTAAEFMRNEVLPHEARLYAHDWDFTRELLRKAAELDLLRLEIPEAYGGLGLDKISAAYVGEQIAVNPSFAGSIGAHTVDRHAADRLLRQRGAEGEVPAEAGERRDGRRLRADRAAVGIRRARREDHRGAQRRRPALPAERPEDVDHERRLRRSVHHLREGRRREVHRLPRRARHGRRERPGREEARARRIVDDRADARQRARCRSRTSSARSAKATRSRSTSSTSAA